MCVDGRHLSGRGSFPLECDKRLDRVHSTLIMRSFHLILNWESERTKGKERKHKKKQKTKHFVIAAVILD